MADGERAWPGVRVSTDAFLRRIAASKAEPIDLAATGRDLFLAAACAEGDTAALEHFERQFVTAVPRHVARLGLSPDQLDELRHTLRVKMMLGPERRIARYDGRAPLDAWLRVVCIRLGLDIVRKEKRGPEGDAELALALVAGPANPEVAVATEDLRARVQRALEAALATLDPQSKALLRMHFVDGANLDALARVLQVHRATVARWLVALRGRVYGEVRRQVSVDIRPTSSEFRSIVRWVRSDLTLSLARLLDPDPR